ncbi:MAG TPA: hypothetical protein VGK67_33585 [Myxococcales bacterium]|jgi:hypothetical protein
MRATSYSIPVLALALLLAACPGPAKDPGPDASTVTTADASVAPDAGAPVCPNGIVEPPETCDGDCPLVCNDGNACTTDVFTGSPKTCDAVCQFVEKTECASQDGCCPAGCAAKGDSDCGSVKPMVAVVLSKAYADDPGLRGRLNRYEEEHPLYEFREVLLARSADPIASMEDRGGAAKRNWLEVRNTLEDLRKEQPQLTGVWLIAESMPTLWRDEALFAIPSGYKASLYPLVALSGDWYSGFDPVSGGFMEMAGVTNGKARGDSYSADLWAAALVPVPGWGDATSQLTGFFDRNHQLFENPPTARKLLHSDTFGFTSRLAPRIDASGYFTSKDTLFLGPNSRSELAGFSSYYTVTVHKQGADYVPSGSSGAYVAQGQAEQAELDAFVAKKWFANQGELRKIGDEKMYYFGLFIRDESLPLQTLRDTFAAGLPPLACGAGDCTVYVADTYFADSTGATEAGHWNAFPDQRAAFQALYTSTLQSGEILYSFITTHGAPDNHYFGITSQLVHDASFSALVYELQACSTADTVATDYNLGATYLFFGNAQAVSGYAQPSNLNCTEGDCFDYMHYLQLAKGGLVIDALFDRDYTMHVYFGDPLLVLP